ncbi:hypothetical protein CABS01_14440 [Colletotrichum abscissum]|uniref:Zn(2)-C6 fungal-type domain-containing protein n=1 Tax=Colletotrichum tamarilloi TaxID=1209934 RepID=A0ABQ9QU07_9PEZI|nr:uncharacterized protein CTAM01_12744 [Colletotrichum tamarilloi]XP_060393288.1 uncharacterized protein CABS01_14440 [Colletotrichum abscissum]KAI3543681.1 hypothetical protein CSPX01_06004 [Colletotrichum filicis]KAK1480302.1 hypothetical protein CABS01_14440 [Colletotrichum abscissum]KAK1485118.1 hypothetical protein CTAM01_12744 [Colletotrichum tamarilloi]
MKMQCKTDGFGIQCARCRNANVVCNYSESGKPGRPAFKTNNSADQTPASWPSLGNTIVEGAWTHKTLHEHGSAVQGSISLEAIPPESSQTVAEWHPLAFPSSPSSFLHLNMTESFGSSDWNPEAAGCSIHTASDDLGVLADPNPLIAIPRATALLPFNRNWMEHLAHFHLKIARPMRSTAYLGPSQLGTEAAHILQSSSEFLELVQKLELAALDCKGPEHPPPIGTAVYLQVCAMSIRLIEMHYWLYSSIYHCLQRRDANFTAQDGVMSDAENGLFISIAGVELIPSPNLRLQMLLQTAVHYLNRVQKARGGLEAIAADAATDGLGSPSLASGLDKLVSIDERRTMVKIQAVLDKLKDISAFSLDALS